MRRRRGGASERACEREREIVCVRERERKRGRGERGRPKSSSVSLNTNKSPSPPPPPPPPDLSNFASTASKRNGSFSAFAFNKLATLWHRDSEQDTCRSPSQHIGNTHIHALWHRDSEMMGGLKEIADTQRMRRLLSVVCMYVMCR